MEETPPGHLDSGHEGLLNPCEGRGRHASMGPIPRGPDARTPIDATWAVRSEGLVCPARPPPHAVVFGVAWLQP